MRGSELGSRAEYVSTRLARLEYKVAERVAELEEEEDEVEARRRQAKAELYELKLQISASGELYCKPIVFTHVACGVVHIYADSQVNVNLYAYGRDKCKGSTNGDL